jgi:hypothetical protein
MERIAVAGNCGSSLSGGFARENASESGGG